MATQTGRQTNPDVADPKRFRELLQKAQEGDECAVQDLWLGFEFDYAKEGGRYE